MLCSNEEKRTVIITRVVKNEQLVKVARVHLLNDRFRHL